MSAVFLLRQDHFASLEIHSKRKHTASRLYKMYPSGIYPCVTALTPGPRHPHARHAWEAQAQEKLADARRGQPSSFAPGSSNPRQKEKHEETYFQFIHTFYYKNFQDAKPRNHVGFPHSIHESCHL